MNNKHPQIKLVYDIGLRVSFLDVLIQNDNGTLLTSVYHKDATEPYVAPFTSDHPPHIFRNTITIALNRAIRYSSTFEAFNTERRYIRLKLLYNGYIFFPNTNYNRKYSYSYRYPSKYIDSRFRKFFTQHNLIPLSTLLPIISKSDQFFVLRNHLLRKLNPPTNNTIKNRFAITRNQERPTFISVNKVWPKSNPQLSVPLIIHAPYENRLRLFRRQLHQLWSSIFQNTNVEQTKLIIGMTTRRNIRGELIQACPPLSKITLPKKTRR